MPETIIDLGRKVKAKYPGQYDDLADADVGRKVKAKYPTEYADFSDTTTAAAAPGPAPDTRTRTGVMVDQMDAVARGVPQAITGIPGAVKALGGLAWDALSGNATKTATGTYDMLKAAAAPLTTPLRGAAALVAPGTFTAPTKEENIQAAEGAGANLGGTLLFGAAPKVLPKARALVPAAAEPLVNRALTATADTLKKSAAGNFERILNPTTKETKFVTRRITPELTKRKGLISATEPGFAAKVGKFKEAALRDVEIEWAKIPANEKLPAKPLIDAIENLKNDFTVENVEIVPAALDRLDGLANTVREFGDEISPRSMRRVRQILDKVVDGASGFGGKDLKASAEVFAQKEVANVFRRYIGEQYPDIKAANAEFSFWSGVDDVMNAKALRDTGKGWRLRDLLGGSSGATVGAVLGGPVGAGVGAVAGPALINFMESTAWRTTSASAKMQIAHLLEAGKYAEVAKLIGPEWQLPENAGGPFAQGEGNFGGTPNDPTAGLPKTWRDLYKNKPKQLTANAETKLRATMIPRSSGRTYTGPTAPPAGLLTTGQKMISENAGGPMVTPLNESMLEALQRLARQKNR